MNVHAATVDVLPSVSTAALPLERLRLALLWLTGFSGAYVFMEPSPYEMVSLLTMTVFAITGLALQAALMPLLLFLVLYNIGFSLAVIPLLGGETKPVTWVAVSWYMATTAVFFAAMLGTNTQARLNALTRGYMFTAIITSIIAILAYFHLLPGAELFLRYDRAQGTFNDPNVFAAFLVFPCLLAWQRVLSGRFWGVLSGGALFALLTVALLLSFSRGAWGQVAFGVVFLMFLGFITSPSVQGRTRIIVIAALGAAIIAGFIAALLSVDQVAGLFKERASLDQSYDTGHTGRFGRHVLGFLLAFETPLGIGPLQFTKFFPEDPHNSYLNAFMSGGWISGLAYLSVVLITVVTSFRYVFVATPWRPIYHVVFASYLVVAGESLIIDSDHWRHYFLLLGVLWGLTAASRHYLSHKPVTRPSHKGLAALPLAHGGRAA
jgi:hypothetical protein